MLVILFMFDSTGGSFGGHHSVFYVLNPLLRVFQPYFLAMCFSVLPLNKFAYGQGPNKTESLLLASVYFSEGKWMADVANGVWNLGTSAILISGPVAR